VREVCFRFPIPVDLCAGDAGTNVSGDETLTAAEMNIYFSECFDGTAGAILKPTPGLGSGARGPVSSGRASSGSRRALPIAAYAFAQRRAEILRHGDSLGI